MTMNDAARKHVSLSRETVFFLEIYQRDYDLPNFSATLERAAVALKREVLKTGYEAFAADYSASTAMQSEAESWLSAPMLEVKP